MIDKKYALKLAKYYRLKVKENKRYQECNIFEKLYRRIKYQPLYFLKALLRMPKSLYLYLIEDDWTSPSLIFLITYYEWQLKADWTYTPEEVEQRWESKKYGK